jgi:nucleoside-diphosphate-sugar epimerase
MSEKLHLVLGTGAVGAGVASQLAEQGAQVRAVNHSGRRPAGMPESVEVVAADLSDPAAAVALADGAGVVYQALNPPYHRWLELFEGLQAAAVAAARTAGARLVSIENLYGYGLVQGEMTESSPMNPNSRKGELRARMSDELVVLAAKGDLDLVMLRSADYYGPGVLGSALGERTFPPLLAGKTVQATGSADALHSFAYIHDVTRSAVTLGLAPDVAMQVVFTPHAPAITQREMLTRAASIAGVPSKIGTLTPFMMRAAGLFIPEAKESSEMMYEFVEPFVVDASASEALLGFSATPVDEGLAATIDWYRQRAAGSDS